MEASTESMLGASVTELPDPVPDRFEKRADGIYEFAAHGGEAVRISGSISVVAFTREKDTGVYGFVARWTDFRGLNREQPFPVALLHEQGTSLAKYLAGLGLDVAPGKEAALSRYLGGYRQQSQIPLWNAAGQIGWFTPTTGALQYVLPTRTIGAGDADLVFQADCAAPTTQSIHSAGSLQNWNESVLERCIGNPYLIFSAGAGLAAPLLKFAGQECGGFHFYGATSRGKTTAAQVAASVMGCGSDPSEEPDKSFVQRWNTTANGLEALSVAHNDNILVLDELGTFQSRDFGSVVYNLLGGKGKRKMTKLSQLMPAKTLNRPHFTSHLPAIQNGTRRGDYEQEEIPGRVQDRSG